MARQIKAQHSLVPHVRNSLVETRARARLVAVREVDRTDGLGEHLIIVLASASPPRCVLRLQSRMTSMTSSHTFARPRNAQPTSR